MGTLMGLLVILNVAATGTHTQTARQLSDQASALYTQSHYAEAEPLYRQAIAAWTEIGTAAALERAIDTRNLGALLRATGRYTEAETMLLDSLKQLDAAAANGVEKGRALYNLAALYRTLDDLAKAETFAERSITEFDRETDLSAAVRLSPRIVLASIYVDERRFDDAEAILKPALADADGPLAVTAFDNLATIAVERGNYSEAEKLSRDALRLARVALPPNHPAVAASWSNLAQACRFEGQYMEAENAYREALTIWSRSVGEAHPDFAKGLMNLAAFYHDRGREAGAESLYQRAAAILEHALGKSDVRTLVARNELADVLRGERRYSEAARIERVTLSSLEKALPRDDARLTRARSNFARLQRESKPAANCGHRNISCEAQTAQ